MTLSAFACRLSESPCFRIAVFRLDGEKGQKLYAEVLASRHGSQLGANEDFVKDHRDAKVEMTLPADGVYYLSLIDAHDSGSALHVYRLMVR